ncbi:hypothetical protein TNCV_4778551 [Trichonephila clavipes]|nr:hypothetical protein TNCV_4778551 [Trichonephila clavipes]
MDCKISCKNLKAFTRDHWTLRCMNRMSRFGGLSEERPSVFKGRSKLSTHLSTHCSVDEGKVDLAQPVYRTRISSIESRHT